MKLFTVPSRCPWIFSYHWTLFRHDNFLFGKNLLGSHCFAGRWQLYIQKGYSQSRKIKFVTGVENGDYQAGSSVSHCLICCAKAGILRKGETIRPEMKVSYLMFPLSVRTRNFHLHYNWLPPFYQDANFCAAEWTMGDTRANLSIRRGGTRDFHFTTDCPFYQDANFCTENGQ